MSILCSQEHSTNSSSMYCAIGKKYLEAFWSDMFKLKKKRDRQKNSKKIRF